MVLLGPIGIGERTAAPCAGIGKLLKQEPPLLERQNREGLRCPSLQCASPFVRLSEYLRTSGACCVLPVFVVKGHPIPEIVDPVVLAPLCQSFFMVLEVIASKPSTLLRSVLGLRVPNLPTLVVTSLTLRARSPGTISHSLIEISKGFCLVTPGAGLHVHGIPCYLSRHSILVPCLGGSAKVLERVANALRAEGS